ncbi:PhzF family phenazine biosynthesis protein [Psychromonas sp. L1A2]|uniref:PhzF family phenazine biosynthesis protein n=1 Tax=Psychromonas sp. L1A2 TaxID=2686356 RepID=UPI0013594D2C|nr:PhzF family phenazine biosynthesis protein [Psychromonas sp. L1A2]
MELAIYVVDAFTEQQFKGNSAAVVPLTEWIADELMQNIAIENNLSETAFIKKITPNRYEIRWFSPLTEIDFCGHATLASSFILFNQFDVQGEIDFVTLEVGTLSVQQLDNGRIQMSFPNQLPEIVKDIPPAVLDGLSIKPLVVMKNRQAYFAVLASANDVLNVEYKAECLKSLAPYDLVVTSSVINNSELSVNVANKSKGKGKDIKADFISRYFWPASGGDEDPVTGSIHAGLAPYWSKQLNKNSMSAYQASKRGGMLYCEMKDDRVLVSGSAVLYLQGKIFV